MKSVSFILFEAYHQRKNIGSSRIRGHWLIKNMEEAEQFVQGKNYETLIFQKTYWKEMAREFTGKKILDICDPDWLDGAEVISFAKEMHAITVPTEMLKNELEKMVDCPVYIIPDRIDLDTLPETKKHEGKAKKVVWFGYSHNLDVLDQTYMKLKKLGLTLKIISDASLSTKECEVENVKWDIETVDKEIQDADFVLMPEYLVGRHRYKSNNKTIHSWALGMPVAKTVEDLERFMDGEERQKEADKNYKTVIEKYNVKDSVKEMREVIDSIKDYGKRK